MKINVENYLHQIDTAFKEKTQKDIIMIYVMIFFGLVAFSYLLFWESAEAQFNKITNEVTALEKKINDDKGYLQINPESKIANLRAQIKQIEEKYTLMQTQNAYIKNKIETISSLIYDERTWGEYLHSISTNAKLFNVNLRNLTNTYAKKEGSFGHILDISVQSTAPFSNTLKFINSLEQSELVIDVHTMNIQAKDKLESDLNISVWGIIY
jgi:type II secretory pathway component PulM